jgi:hypothetical protein
MGTWYVQKFFREADPKKMFKISILHGQRVVVTEYKAHAIPEPLQQ